MKRTRGLTFQASIVNL